MLFSLFDNETTGLNKHRDTPHTDQPRVIEFGGIITDGERILDQLELICNPGMKIEQIITDITGLTNEDLEDKPPFSAFYERIADYFAQANAVIAHNLSFDRQIMKTELAFMGFDSLHSINWPQIEVCTVEQMFPRFGKRMKLSELYEREFGQYQQKHRAIDDVMLLHQICQRYGVYDALKAAHNV